MKTVLVTGGSRGIGKAIVYKFAEAGYNVILNYNKSEEAAIKIAKELNNVMPFKADVSVRSEVREMFNYANKTFGQIDVLINNAGIANYALLQNVSEEDWNSMVNVNLTGVFNCTQLALPDMINRKAGKIINISSIWGMVGASYEVVYSTVKAGVIGMTKALAKEVGPSNINVNCIAPGAIMTDMLNDCTMEELDEMTNQIPLQRIGSTEDIANLALFLASEEANYITGQVISPNGGWVM
jgi:3-oxoacyl-[acyl-carrier protein] reductase